MSLFECKACGGTLKLLDNGNIGECEYCGRMQAISHTKDELRADKLNRANYYRRENNYDRAIDIYNELLNEDGSDADIYWSIILCRFGIAYEVDKKTGQRLPTINRFQNTSILADADYKLALQYADPYQAKVYERDAKEIYEIQSRYLEIVQTEEPFDVFISYKDKVGDTDEPTEDRAIAMEIYNKLHHEKLKVFFSHYTLDDKLGEDYEPYIFAALNSAKVMIVLGTKKEYFEAPWVKNEWSRYHTLMQSDPKKSLIVAYKNMNPYDLPDKLAGQKQDMGKLGSMENLVYVVCRNVERYSAKKGSASSNGKQSSANDPIKEIALDDGGLYKGDALAGKPHGNGTCIYENGDKYEGAWAFGKYNGKGKYHYANGDFYDGEFSTGLRNGNGKLTRADGTSWEGIWKDDSYWEGEGTHIINPQSVFMGHWSNGKRNGEGTCTYESGDKYEGEWSFDKRNGKGKYYYANGDCYDGEFSNGMRDGKGVLTRADGTSWEGVWKDDKYWKGYGTHTYSDGVFCGHWSDGKRNGEGVLNQKSGEDSVGIWKDDILYNGYGKLTNDIGYYIGNVKSGQREGDGTFFWYAHSYLVKYTGQWKNDVREGHGIVYWKSGERWDGMWKNNGAWKGTGKYYYDSGEYNGSIENGSWTGQGTWYHYESKCKFTGTFANNRCYKGKWSDGTIVKNGKNISVREQEDKHSKIGGAIVLLIGLILDIVIACSGSFGLGVIVFVCATVIASFLLFGENSDFGAIIAIAILAAAVASVINLIVMAIT